MTELLMVSLKCAVVLSIFAIGLGATFSDLKYLWQRPGLLLRSLVSMYVLVPLAALMLVQLLPLEQGAKAALLVLAVSAGAPLLPKKLGPLSSDEYVFSLVVASSVLAIVWVPTWIGLLGRYFDADLTVTPVMVVKTLATAFLLPLAVGMGLRMLLPAWAERVSDRLVVLAGVVLGVAALALLVTHWEILLNIKPRSFLSLVLLLGIALVIGHLMGGPTRDNRTSLAIACATRHIGVAILVSTSFPGPGTAVLIATYVVASMLVSIPYLRWRKRPA